MTYDEWKTGAPDEPDLATIDAVCEHFGLEPDEVTSDVIEQFYQDKRTERAERKAGI